MLLTRPKSPSAPRRGSGGGGPLSTRGGTVLVAALLSLVAGAVLLVFLRQYRDDVGSSERVRVVVAASLLPKGTRGDVVLEKRLYRVARVREDDLRSGALTDPADLSAKAVTDDVFPGHQLTLGDLKDTDNEISTRLSDYQRAMTVPVDKAHGMIGKIERGDRVDVLTTGDSAGGGVTIATVALRDALVLGVPDSGDSSRTQQVTLRVPDRAAATIAAASDNGEVWLVLRPPLGARSHATPDATATGATPDGEPLNADIDISARVRSR
jgi:Flp pilus assembly protein CpaB